MHIEAIIYVARYSRAAARYTREDVCTYNEFAGKILVCSFIESVKY